MNNLRQYLLLVLIVIITSCSNEDPIIVPNVNISLSNITIPETGTNPSSFSITSNIAWSINTSDARASSWLKIEPMNGAAGTTTITVSALNDNETYDDRTANITIVAGDSLKTISVTQKKKDAIILSKNKFEIGSNETEIQVYLKSNVDYTIEIPSEYKSWIIKESASNTKSLQDYSEFFTIKEGSIEGARNGYIVFKNGELRDTAYVYQSQKDAVSFTQKEYFIDSENTSIAVEVKSNIEYETIILNNITWVTQSQTKALQTNTINFSIEKNESVDNRTAKIVLKGKNSILSDTLTINQTNNVSKDGEVVTLQQASVGNGINIVILGDGFLSKDLGSGGSYETYAKEAMEHFFAKEPVKTFRNRFNVYCVKAVSQKEAAGSGAGTAFSTLYGDGTSIEGDDDKCFEYALKVPSINNKKNVTIITILNDSKYAGTCWMYYDNSSIAYCPIVEYNAAQFAQIIQHEGIGHGFGKLADEYGSSGQITQIEKQEYDQMYNSDGWWNNIDFTNNSLTIKWGKYLSNSLYTNLVGIYTGGATFRYGVYRPTENSIMRYNVGEFNAPSREAIYSRIMNLSGETYSFENFLEYDAINRSTVRSTYSVPENFVPLASPVVVKSK